MNSHIVNQIKNPGVKDGNNTLYVIGVCSNPVRFHSRYRLARKFIEEMSQTKCVKLVIVEGAYKARHFELKDECAQNCADHIPIHLHQEIWVKESMINVGINHTKIKYPGSKYFAWVDMDVSFRNPNWAQDAIHQLQHYPIIQPWQTVANLGPTGNIMNSWKSVGEMIREGVPPLPKGDNHFCGNPYYSGDPKYFGHTGYAWCCTREFFENVGGLIDFAILGSADHHCALGCRGYYSHSVHSMMGGNFKELIHAWQTRAMQLTHGVIGWASGSIEHHFHGRMKNRHYVDRWKILVENKFDPVHDLRRDDQGIVYLVGKPKLLHDIMKYNRDRLEDDVYES
jgi:hypothetical protein